MDFLLSSRTSSTAPLDDDQEMGSIAPAIIGRRLNGPCVEIK
jgi:hypothetical protein